MQSAFLIRCQSRSLGRLSQAWLSCADHADYGPDHALTLSLQRAACIELDSLKTGKKLNPEILKSSADVPRPEYLVASVADKAPHDSVCRGAFRELDGIEEAGAAKTPAVHRSRIIGKLYDISNGGISAVQRGSDVQLALNMNLGLELDPHLRFLSSCVEEQRVFDGLYVRWVSYFMDYKVCVAKMLGASKSTIMRKTAVDKVRAQYRLQFDLDAEEVYNETFLASFGPLSSLPAQQCADSFGQATIRGLLEHSRVLVAQAVYAAVYRNTKKSKYSHELPLAFVWDVCGDELHSKKARSVLVANGESSFSLLNSDVRDLLLNL
jgi:hypothetical protein